MTRRRALLLVASFALSGFLIVVLVKVGKINLHATLEHLRHVSRIAFAGLVVLTALHIYLSNLKWRKIDAFLRRSSDSAPSGTASFAFTSLGVVLGQILPVQISMSAARTIGTYFYGSPLKRGTAGTLFEQSFDVLIVGFLAIASAITWFCRGGAAVYIIATAVMALISVLAVAPSIRAVQSLVSATANRKRPGNRIIRRFAEMDRSGFLNASLARQLMMLSAARFVIQVLMAWEVAEAVGAHISVWQLAAATPLVTIAYALAIAPGGLGISELSYAFVLNLFGTPLSVGAQWALENRVLVFLSCLLIASCGSVLLGIERIAAYKMRGSPGASPGTREITQIKSSTNSERDSR